MRSEKKELAFVDLAVHEHTKSSEFIMDLFREQFNVVNIWYDYGPGEKKLIKEIEKYEYIFFLQVLLPYHTLINFQKAGKKIIWAPMYDGLPKSNYYWGKIASAKIKILSFNSGIDVQCKKHFIDHLSIRYYLEPREQIADLQKERFVLYFWYRGSIQFKDWIGLFPQELIEKIYYYSAPLGAAFRNEILSEEEIANYKIEKIDMQTFSVNRNTFLQYLEKADVFICPRKQDGIGLPLIEAISFGKFIVGHNDYTMKDYIRHNQNGFLFSLGTSEKISLTTIRQSLKYRQQYAEEGYKKWMSDEIKVKNIYSTFIFTPLEKSSLKIYWITLFEFAKKILKKIINKK